MRQRPLMSFLGRAIRALRRGLTGLSVVAVTAGLLTAAPLPPATAAVADGLVLWYKLDETSGTSAADASGHGRSGTVNGTADWGGAEGLAFDGSSTYVKAPDGVLAGLTSVTVATDVYVDQAQGTPYFIYGLGNTTSWYGDGYLMASGDRLRGTIASGNWSTEQNTEPSPSRNLARGSWKHLAYTQTGTTGILYEDGVEVARNTSVTITPGSIGNGTTTANYLGKSNYTGDKLLKGRMRDFRLYDRALDPSEVSGLARPAVTESVAADTAALSLGDTSAVTADLTLPATGGLGSKITWTSSGPAVVSTSGKVTRPAFGTPDATVTLTATLTKAGVTDTKAFTVTVLAAADDATVAKAAADAFVVHNVDDVRGNLTLPATGASGTTVTWTSSDPAVISPTGVVHRPAAGSPAAAVTLTAKVTYKTTSVTRDLIAKVPALPAPAAKTGYLFSYFTGEGTADGEQLHFALSQGNTPLTWSELNGGKPVLTTSLGTKGVRDPFIIRSPEGDKFYQIATDLRIYGNGDWDASQRTGSKSIVVWESTDLVHWTDQRLVKVSPDTAGNTWAPEAMYDASLGAYVVFWASKLYAADDPNHTGSTYNRMMYATTRDFWTFSEPKVWKDPGYSVIDSTVTEHNGTYYRLTKDERNNTSSTPCSKFIMEERSTSLINPDWDLVAECLGKGGVSAGEGPSIFKSNVEDKWYLLIDEFGGRGYVPFSSTDLASGTWTMEPKYSLPNKPRHGTVIGITQAEWDRLKARYDPPKTVTGVDGVRLDTAVGVAPRLPATVTFTFADGTRRPVGVTWNQIPPSAYAAPRTFTVEGAIAGSTVKAKAVVTVVAETSGLLVHYQFDETGGTVATDSSGRGNHGTYVGNPTFGAGSVGGAVVLAGGASDSNAPYVSIPNGVLAGAQNLTVATWVTWSGTGGDGQWIYGLGLDSNRYVFSGPNWSKSAILRSGITLNSWQAEKGMSSTSALPSGSWQHLAVVVDSTAQTATMYLNGTAIATATEVTIKPSDLYDATKSVSGYIGKSLFPGDAYFNGAVDDFRVYDRALSAAEITRLASRVPDESKPDTTPPVVTASVAPAAGASGWHTAGPVTVTITAKDTVDSIVTPQARITGPGFTGQWAPATAPPTLTADGDYVVEYRAVDTTGNVSEVKSVRIRLDSTPPVSRAAVDKTARTVTLTATDALSGAARVEFSTNGGSTWTPYTTPVTVGPAATTVTYRGVDVAGNTEPANQVVVPDGSGTDPAPSQVKATLTSTTVAYGNASRVNLTVTGGLPTKPTGTIRVLDGSTEVGTGTLSANGKETVTLAADLPVGVHTLKILYSGDPRYAASEATATLTVVNATTRTRLSISKSAIKTGKTNKATIDVTATTKATVTGTVTLRIIGAGWDMAFTAHLQNGKAVVTLGPFTRPGTVTAVASYPGSADLEASASTSTTFTVS
jgi:hypothetical protein